MFLDKDTKQFFPCRKDFFFVAQELYLCSKKKNILPKKYFCCNKKTRFVTQGNIYEGASLTRR